MLLTCGEGFVFARRITRWYRGHRWLQGSSWLWDVSWLGSSWLTSTCNSPMRSVNKGGLWEKWRNAALTFHSSGWLIGRSSVLCALGSSWLTSTCGTAQCDP